MKKRIEQLIATYEAMLKATRSKIRRECLENVIEDLKTCLRESNPHRRRRWAQSCPRSFRLNDRLRYYISMSLRLP